MFLFCSSASAGEPIEVMMHEGDVYGARDIESGNYQKGVDRLLTRLDVRTNSGRTRVLVDLCAGYTLLEDFEAAEEYCDAAVQEGWSTGLALNNRGALHVAMGDYESAIQDFQAAIDTRGADSIARRNLQRIEQTVAAMQRPSDAAVAWMIMDPE